MRYRRPLTSASLAAIVLLIAPSAPAQGPSSGIRLKVEPRWGVATPGQWAPYLVTVENTAADFSGELVLIPATAEKQLPGQTRTPAPPVKPSPAVRSQPALRLGGPGAPQGDQRGQLTLFGERYPDPIAPIPLPEVSPARYPVVRRPVSVAGGGGRQEFVVTVLEPKFGYWAELRNSAGERVAAVRRPQPQVGGTVAVFTASKQLKPVMDLVESQLKGTAVFTRWDSARDLPFNALGLSGLSVLVIEDLETAALNRNQIQALQTWIDFGGALVIGGSQSARRDVAGLPEDLVPFKPVGSQLGSLAALAGDIIGKPNGVAGPDQMALRAEAGMETPLMVGPIGHGGPSVETPEGEALIVESQHGSGRIIQLAFGLFSDQLATRRTIAPIVWQNVLWRTQAHDQLSYEVFAPIKIPDDGEVWQPLLDQPPWPLPGVLGMLFFLGYVLLLGPLGYFLLRALGKRELAWLTIPFLSVAGVLSVWIFADKVRERSAENVVEVQTVSEGGFMRSETFRSRYTLEEVSGLKLPAESAASAVGITKPKRKPRMGTDGPNWGTISNLPNAVNIRLGGHSAWQIRTMQSVRFQSGNRGGLDAKLRTDSRSLNSLTGLVQGKSPRLTGTVTNRSSEPIYDLVAQVAGGQARISRELGPKETLKVDASIEIPGNVADAPLASLEERMIHAAANRAGDDAGVVLVGRLNKATSTNRADGSFNVRIMVANVRDEGLS